ncbi:nucleolar complex protein [Xylariales sp. AK1849]|nr:nucleolar complex protein [Xylariales sp. AK1849]
MPGKTVETPLKRKRSKNAEKPQKRARSESSSENEDPQADILLLENEVFESKKNYNNITKLLGLIQETGDTEASLLAAVSLCRVFLRLLTAGSLTRNDCQSEKEKTVCLWLKGRLSDYKQVVVAMLGQEDTASTALTLVMRILKAEGQYLNSKEEYNFPRVYLKEIVTVLVQNGTDDVRQEFCEKFVGEYCDVRYHAFRALRDILSEAKESAAEDDLFGNAFNILSFFEDVPDSADDLGDFYTNAPNKKHHPVTSLTQQKRAGQEAWLALLNLGPNRDQRKQVLDIMTRSIAPWFTKPELLADFLSDSYNSGGSISLLALSGVFYLIQHRNLDYPSFYQKLYSLLNAEILHSKHRSKFLRLLDTFLASTHLPAVLVASFVKKLARLCLNAPPTAIVAVVPWCYNVLKKHPLCTFMVHRVLRTQEEKTVMQDEGLSDPFNAEELNPMETHAIDSCLWEIVQLQSHYHPNVATIAKIVGGQFTKQSYNMEDFLDHSYSSLLDAELSKQIKKPPVVEFMIPKRVFLPQDPASGVEDNLLTKLWSF